jgi:NADPH:quinone reductase-like Zn-dependent oxidoreductase
MSTQTMQSIRVHQYGGPEELKLERIQRPEPQADEVLIRVHAAAVNPTDWKMRQGLLKDFLRVQFPYIPGLDLAGVVEEIGPGVTAFQKGQAVFGQSLKGVYAEYTTAPVEMLALKPKTLSFDEAVAVPLSATAAWKGIFDQGGLQAGQRILIQGAAGGVGMFAVQFARRIGAQVIGTTSTANVDFVRSLGAETVIDYTTTPVEQAAHDIDLVLDTIGGQTLESSLRVLKRGGTLIPLAGGQPPEEKARELDVRVVEWFSTLPSSELLHTFAQLIDEGQIKVAIAGKFPLSEARQAHERSQSGHGRGRIVLHIAD